MKKTDLMTMTAAMVFAASGYVNGSRHAVIHLLWI